MAEQSLYDWTFNKNGFLCVDASRKSEYIDFRSFCLYTRKHEHPEHQPVAASGIENSTYRSYHANNSNAIKMREIEREKMSTIQVQRAKWKKKSNAGEKN